MGKVMKGKIEAEREREKQREAGRNRERQKETKRDRERQREAGRDRKREIYLCQLGEGDRPGVKPAKI